MDGIANARIKSTMLGLEDHGILTCVLTLDFGDSEQGFGGYQLDGPSGMPSLACGLVVARILVVVGVSRWENLTGCHVRAERRGGLLRRLGNIIADRWFDPEEVLKRLDDET